VSPIELSFGELRQFGYALFGSPASTFAPVDEVPVGPDYVMGPGDDMVVNVWGAMDAAIVRTVDRNGRIFLPKVGPVRVWGLTFAQADRMIREELGRYFRGFYTTVTLGRLRTIRVHVVGEVCQPGSYTVSSLSTLTNALYAGGGPTKLGSLREIRLLRNNQLVGTLDLYDFLLKGSRAKDYRLESGDTIFIPTIGATVGIEGEVKRPAIYELREPLRVSELILMAGGVTPRSYLRRVQVVRQQPNAERTAIDLDVTGVFMGGDRSGDLDLVNGDLVRIFPTDYRVYNVVHFAGAVKYPGDYELRPGTRISHLLTRESVLPEAQVERVEIVRRRPDLSTEIFTLDLKQAWTGNETHDVVLRPLDEVTVRTELRSVGIVALEGEVKRPGQYSIARGERLSSVIRRAGGLSERAYLRGAVFTRLSLKAIEQEQLNTFVKVQEQKLLQAASTPIIGGELDQSGTQGQSQMGIMQARRELLRALATRVAVGRMVVRLDQPDKLENTPDDVILEDGDSLKVPEPPSSVLVIGSVRTSTSVQHKEGMGVDYYINRVGGLTKEADKKEVHLVKADGSAASGFSKIRTVEPGDTIIVPPKEEEKIRVLPTVRDVLTIFGQTLISIAALAVLF
jgi:protein involved in polysaccharide export with SLBB domain